MEKLYKFQKLGNYLDKHGFPFPEIEPSKIEIVRGNVLKNIRDGKVEFKKDGTYIFHNKQWQKVFMFIKSPTIERATKYNPEKSLKEKLPKFHLIRCQTIRNSDFIGDFDSRFDFSNNKTVDLEDFDEPLRKYSNQVLEICTYCRREILDQIDYKTTEGFFDLLDIQEEDVDFKEVEVDIRGYTKDWRQRSEKFRIKNNYICNECKLDLTNDKRNLEVHHIDREKRNNNEDNLECRCLYCHTIVDEHHIKKFKESKDRQIRMKNFIAKYGNHLKQHYKTDNLKFI